MLAVSGNRVEQPLRLPQNVWMSPRCVLESSTRNVDPAGQLIAMVPAVVLVNVPHRCSDRA